MDGAKYVSHAAPVAIFLQYASHEPFLNGDLARQYFEVASEPKRLQIYDAPRALNAEATATASLSSRNSFPASCRTPIP
jgi:hypothetical protein